MSDDPDREPNAIPARGVLLAILGCVGIVALAAAAAWFLFPAAHRNDDRPPGPVAGIPLEIRPVEVNELWLARQRALLAGAEGRLPIGAAMNAVVAAGRLDGGTFP